MSTNDIRRTFDTLRVTRAVDDATGRVENTLCIYYSMQIMLLLVVLARLEAEVVWQLIYLGTAALALLCGLHGMWVKWRAR